MPKYKELSVEKHWESVKNNLEITQYFPDYPKNVYPRFEDFWNVLLIS